MNTAVFTSKLTENPFVPYPCNAPLNQCKLLALIHSTLAEFELQRENSTMVLAHSHVAITHFTHQSDVAKSIRDWGTYRYSIRKMASLYYNQGLALEMLGGEGVVKSKAMHEKAVECFEIVKTSLVQESEQITDILSDIRAKVQQLGEQGSDTKVDVKAVMPQTGIGFTQDQKNKAEAVQQDISSVVKRKGGASQQPVKVTKIEE
ncbi:hypothetical protein RCL1_008869 [Eukaryota sp. TZLM3-RCL]